MFRSDLAGSVIGEKCGGSDRGVMIQENIILFGVGRGFGSAGREVLQYLYETGRVPLAFSDNNERLWGTDVDGSPVLSPSDAMLHYPDATFVVTVFSAVAKDIRNQLRAFGVKIAPINRYLPVRDNVLPLDKIEKVRALLTEKESRAEFDDQISFRQNLNYEIQRPSSNPVDLYFPKFIRPLPDEVFIDCGAADGDTVRDFMRRRTQYGRIIALEPDFENYKKLTQDQIGYESYNVAVGRRTEYVSFAPNLGTGSYVTHTEKSSCKVPCIRLDSKIWKPTYIKMDIEGSEIDALCGAWWTIQALEPALAICAYHKPSDLWEIPLLLHDVVPSYELRFRRYAEGNRELVWYAIPPDRVVEYMPGKLKGFHQVSYPYHNESSMGDDHVG